MIELMGAQVWVHDQDEALEFYPTELGFEPPADASVPEMGFRRLAVGVPGQAVQVPLMRVPGPPIVDGDTSEEICALVAPPFPSGAAASFRDPSGDSFRLTERTAPA